MLPCGGLRVNGEKRPRLLNLEDQLMMTTRNVATARAIVVVSIVERSAYRAYAQSCQDVGVEAEAKKCSLACAKAAGSEDKLPCDRPETSWSKSVEEATVADTAALQEGWW